MTKRLISLLLVLAMVLTLVPTYAFAAEQTTADVTTASVNFTAQAYNAFLAAPQRGVSVASNLAESYGFTDNVQGVSVLDVLVKAHELVFGEAFTAETASTMLAVGSSGFVTTMFGMEASSSGFMVNDGYPNDGTESEWGGYNGTTVTTQAVVDGDSVNFFLYQDSVWMDNYSYITVPETVNAGEAFTATVKGTTAMMGYLYATPAAMQAAASALKGAQLGWVDLQTGSVTAIAGAVTGAEGTASVTAPAAAGEYWLTAFMPSELIEEEEGTAIVMNLAKVTVQEAGEALEEISIYAYNSFFGSLELYSYADGEIGTVNLLEGVQPASNYYKTSVPAGDYLAKGIHTSGEELGTLVITVEQGGTNNFELCAAMGFKASNSGWVLDVDYTMEVQISAQDRTPRIFTLGPAGTSSKGVTAFCLKGDTVEITCTPTEIHPDFQSAYKSQTLTTNTSGFGVSCPQTVMVTFTVPAGSTLSVGTLKTYYVYTFTDVGEPATAEDGSLVYTMAIPKNTDYFYRVQNPNGVTYWNYARWAADTAVEVTAADLYIGSEEFTSTTVDRSFQGNKYDRADIYLNINSAGYMNLAQGESFELNSFRNWFAIESISNAKVALPDMHYQVIGLDGKSTDVVTVTPDAKNSNVAVMTANHEGAAIVLVTYDSMTHKVGYGGTRFSAIWPECTGVFVVTVDKDGTGIQTNMNIDRMTAASSPIDAEHDILFYVGDAGASYSFAPETGCTVTVARSTVTDTMSFNGFTAEGVVTAEDGTVTVSGLTTGRHIIRVEKDGVASYQVITARQVSYVIKDAQGNDLTAESEIRAGDTIQIQFSNLINPKEKLSGAYNFNASLYYQGEEGTFFQSNPGSAFGVYDFSSNPVRQLISITIPKYWAGDTYTMTGAIKMGGFAGVPTHRGITYAKGTNPAFDAPNVASILGELPELTISLAKTNFLTGKLTFVNEKGESVNRADLTITMTDASGNTVVVAEDGSFPAVAETFSYTILANGFEYTMGSVDVTEEQTQFTVVLQTGAENGWDGATYAEPQKDEDGVYQISTGAQLAWLSKQVADRALTGFSAKLLADIDLGYYPWTPINTNGFGYAYQLDGDGHTIAKLNTNKGLFNILGSGSLIKNLTVTGKVTTTNAAAGGIAGYLQGGTIENCVNEATITATGASNSSYGGIAGYMYNNAYIANCVNKGAISVEGKQVGGIVGYTMGNKASVTGCYNLASVSGGTAVGGIIGSETNGIVVADCYNRGAVSGNENVGGVVGQSGKTAFSGCYNVGTVTGGKGFVGTASNATFSKCFALTADDYAEVLSETAMKSADLGDGYKLVCRDYPALTWQTDVTLHAPQEESTVTAPTCVDRGYTTYTCSNCGETFMGDYVNALGHTEGADLKTFPARKEYTCAVCGEAIVEWNDARLENLTMPEANATVTMADTTYPWSVVNGVLRSGNKGMDSTVSETMLTFTLDNGGKLSFDYSVSSESGYDKLTITLGETKIADAISGNDKGTFSQELEAGTYTLKMSFSKDSSSAGGDDMAYVSNLVLTADSNVLTIVNQPESFVGAVGQTANFTVEVNRDDVSYQWYYSANGGETWKKSVMEGSTTDTLIVPMLAFRVGQMYRCEVVDSEGEQVVSEAVSLQVAAKTVTIVTEPENYVGTMRSTASFHVEATGDDLSYQWYYSNNGGKTWNKSSLTGCTTDTLTVQLTAARVGQQYKCVVTAASGDFAETQVVTMTESVPTVKITAQPENQAVAMNTNAVFTVKAEGEGLTYQWYYSSSNGAYWNVSTMDGCTTDTLTVKLNSKRIGQQYKCVVTDANGYTEESNPVVLTLAD